MMPFPHAVTVVGDVAGGSLDPDGEDRGHLATTVATFFAGAGWIQPRSARERASVLATGVSIGTHRIYLDASAVGLVDADMTVVKAGTPGADLNGSYRIREVRNAAGVGHHMELDADRIDQ